METTHAIIVLFAVAVIVLLVLLARRPGAGRAASHGLQELRTIVDRLDQNVSNQLTPRVQSVDNVAKDLHRTLQSPNRRGQWAEQSLTNILEDSGLREGVDYAVQFTVRDGDSRLKPDAVVFMPKGIKVVIDAKAVWDSYQEAQLAPTDQAAEPLLERHAATLLATAEDLCKKDYSGAIGGSGESLDKALTAYNDGVGSLQRRVLPQARRFTKLGAVARTEQLTEPELVQGAAREVVPEQ